MITLKPSFSRTQFHCLALGLIIVIAAISYANTFRVPFVFDDYQNIETNRHLRIEDLSLTSLSKAASQSPSKHRWLPNITFALNYYWHGLDVRGYHLVNLMVHTSCGMAVYFLSLVTLNLPGLPGRFNRIPEVSLIAALLWTTHPLQTNAVTYIVQRMTSMAALFFVLCVLFYALGRTQGQTTGSKLSWFGASLLSGLLALLSKENTAMLPVVLAGYELFFFEQVNFNRKQVRAITVIALGLLLLILSAIAFTSAEPLKTILAGYDTRAFTPMERLLTQSRIFWLYVSLILLPLPQRLNLSHDFPISHSLVEPITTLVALLALGMLLVITVKLFHKHRLVSFAIFWFVFNLLIESTIIPLELVFEHRLYLPSIFLFIAAIAYLSLLTSHWTLLFRTGAIIIIGLCLTFTYQRNQVWQNEISLWQDVLNKSPELPRAYDYLAKAYLDEGRFSEGFTIFEKAYQKGLADTNLYVAWAKAAFENGQIDQATFYLKWALKLNPNNGEAHYNLGIIYGNQGMTEEANHEIAIGMQLKSQQNF